MFRIAIAYMSILAATAGLVLLLNAFGAGAGVSVAVFALFSAAIGFAIAYFIDWFPEIPNSRRAKHGPGPPRA